jgi:DNA-directed RNA polymerase subunit RPC12/RpoP
MSKTCPHCGIIEEPNANELSKYARYWRDNRCPTCGSLFAEEDRSQHEIKAEGSFASEQNIENKITRLIKSPRDNGVSLTAAVIGLILLFFFPIGTVIGIILLVTSYAATDKYICSECGNKIDNKGVRICPTCHSRFE